MQAALPIHNAPNQQPHINLGPTMGMLRGAVLGAFNGTIAPSTLYLGQKLLAVAPEDATFTSTYKELILPALVGFTICGAVSGIIGGLWASHPKTC
jgi:hypothetical protein